MTADQARLIVLLDEAASRSWKGPVTAAAERAGYRVELGPAPETFDTSERVVVMSNDINWTVHFAPAACTVAATGWTPSLPAGDLTLTDRHAIYQTAVAFVVSTSLLEKGALLVDGRGDAARIPGLGEIQPATTGGPSSSAAGLSPLSFYATLPPRLGSSTTWPAELFSYQKNAFEPGSPDIDLTGRARTLLHGPYIYLPEGRWRAEITLTVEPLGQPVELRVEWGGNSFETVQATVSKAGVYRVALEHTFVASAPAQVVLWLDRPTFQGRLVFGGCEVSKVAEYDASALEAVPLPAANEA